MVKRTCLLLEVGSIQSYIFGSNQLAQNIGASELVALSTTKWVVDVLDDMGLTHNGRWDEGNTEIGPVVEYVNIADPAVEIVYAGGGNAMILFSKRNTAVSFVKKLSRFILEEAPNLNFLAIHDEFEDDTQALAEVHRQLRRQMNYRQMNRPFSTPLLGLSVTAECVYTGLPAIGLDSDEAAVGQEAALKVAEFDNYQPRLISAEVAAKLRYENVAKERLHKVLPNVKGHKLRFGFVYDFDELGEYGESSYLAVIHADGNRMGERFKALGEKCKLPEDNEKYVTGLQALSKELRLNATKALQETVDYLMASLGSDNRFGDKVRIPRTRKGLPLLPFRPIVFGGDDVTFVCDGRLGLDLAARYLDALSQKPLGGEQLFARAGVAIVKTHYPFSRAYELSEELAKQAKNEIEKTFKIVGNDSANVLDWHFATTGMMHDITEVRQREYTAYDGNSLLMRPVCLNEYNEQWRTWPTFRSLMTKFQRDEWENRRNKLLALREALRQGEAAVDQFLNNYGIENLPEIAGYSTMAQHGWQNGKCAYYDAIEAIDFFVDLASTKESAE